MSTATLTERNLTEESSLVGTVEAGLIRGVKLLGLSSKNNRRYSEQALAKALDSKIYEGATVYVDHPPRGNQSRSYRDRFARIEAVRQNKDGLFGDLRFNPRHPLAEQIVWDATHKTEGVGLSHNIVAGCRSDKSGEIIEEITKVHSVDLVDNPATTRTLFESCSECEHEQCPMKMKGDKEKDKPTVAASLEQYMDQYPLGARKLLQEMATDPVMSATVGQVAASPEDAIKSGMRTAVMAAFDDPSLDSAETLNKIKSLLAALDAALGKAETDPGQKVAEELPPPATPDGETDPTAAKPADKPPVEPDQDDEKNKKFEQLQRRAWALECLAQEQIKPSDLLVKELTEQRTPTAMKALVGTWSQAKRGSTKPVIRTRLTESHNQQAYPETHEAFIAAAKR